MDINFVTYVSRFQKVLPQGQISHGPVVHVNLNFHFFYHILVQCSWVATDNLLDLYKITSFMLFSLSVQAVHDQGAIDYYIVRVFRVPIDLFGFGLEL